MDNVNQNIGLHLKILVNKKLPCGEGTDEIKRKKRRDYKLISLTSR